MREEERFSIGVWGAGGMRGRGTPPRGGWRETFFGGVFCFCVWCCVVYELCRAAQCGGGGPPHAPRLIFLFLFGLVLCGPPRARPPARRLPRARPLFFVSCYGGWWEPPFPDVMRRTGWGVEEGVWRGGYPPPARPPPRPPLAAPAAPRRAVWGVTAPPARAAPTGPRPAAFLRDGGGFVVVGWWCVHVGIGWGWGLWGVGVSV